MLNSWNIQLPWNKPKKGDDSINDTFGTDASRPSLVAVYAEYDNFHTYRGQVQQALACAPFATGIHKLQTIISELTFTSEHKKTKGPVEAPQLATVRAEVHARPGCHDTGMGRGQCQGQQGRHGNVADDGGPVRERLRQPLLQSSNGSVRLPGGALWQEGNRQTTDAQV